MSLELRRKAKANAAATPTAEVAPAAAQTASAAVAAEPKAPRKARTKKVAKATGSMRTIANGRHYKDGHVAQVDENNMPKVRSVFDPAGRAAKSVDTKTFDKEKILPLKDLIQHLNQELFRPLFGQPLRGQVARDLIMGFADVLTSLTENGVTYRIPNGFTAEPVLRAEYTGHNPRTKEPFQVKAHRTVRIRPTRAVKEFLASGG